MAERTIHILPEQVASQIAAGEVVERPASALKELVENALDAGAHAVSVELERGGMGLLAVGDDGSGMGREDALLSLRRHATSKLGGAADLNAIRTLGFRGEALAAIASVAHLRMRTCRAGDPEGLELAATAGLGDGVRACAMAAGTRIEVRDLFFNIPARLKFLKSVATEQGAAAAALQRLALAYPRVAFRLVADGRTLFDLPRAATSLERMRALFGARVTSRMLEFDAHVDGMRAWGLCATSQESYGSPRLVFTFVNRRVVRDRLLTRAIGQAYQTLLPRGRHPAVALFVEVRPEEVDVNVHPMKTEVRFRRSGAVFELAYHALRGRLADQTTGTILLAPVSAGRDGVVGAPAPAGQPTAAVSAWAPPAPAEIADSMASFLPAPPAAAPAPASVIDSLHPVGRLRLVADAPARLATQPALGLGFTSTAAAPGARPVPEYARLRVIGQLFAGYIALEDDDGLVLVDQHAAHERVTFERLRAEWYGGGVRVQPLLTPATLNLNPARAAQILAGLDQLRLIGFECEPFGPATLVLKGTPAVFATGGVELLQELLDGIGDYGFDRGERVFEERLKLLACHGSVRAGRVLQPDEITALLGDLDRTEFKTNCPHGRPVHIRFPRGQLERMFRR